MSSTFVLREGEPPVPDNVLDPAGWRNRWQNGQIGFHKSELHPMLQAHLDKLLNGRQAVKIFFPLCGKALDMNWLYREGHTIIGVEASPLALEQFYTEHNIEYVSEPVPSVDGTLYKSKDGRIRLYSCDFYKFNKSLEGQVDAMWDRGSFVAINKADRKKYVDVMLSLMKPDTRLLLDTFDYDPTKYAGPPHFIPEEQITELYDPSCTIERVDFKDILTDRNREWGLDRFEERVDLIIPKQ